jgi:hypothetical protein
MSQAKPQRKGPPAHHQESQHLFAFNAGQKRIAAKHLLKLAQKELELS